MAEELPNPRQYDVPANITSAYERHMAAISAEDKEDISAEDLGDEESMVPSVTSQRGVGAVKVDTSGMMLSSRAALVLRKEAGIADSLLTWYSFLSSRAASATEVDICVNGFTITISVVEAKREDGQIVLTLRSSVGISFKLQSGSKVSLAIGGAAPVNCIFLNRIDMGVGFPFLFMVFLEE